MGQGCSWTWRLWCWAGGPTWGALERMLRARAAPSPFPSPQLHTSSLHKLFISVQNHVSILHKEHPTLSPHGSALALGATPQEAGLSGAPPTWS